MRDNFFSVEIIPVNIRVYSSYIINENHGIVLYFLQPLVGCIAAFKTCRPLVGYKAKVSGNDEVVII